MQLEPKNSASKNILGARNSPLVINCIRIGAIERRTISLSLQKCFLDLLSLHQLPFAANDFKKSSTRSCKASTVPECLR